MEWIDVQHELPKDGEEVLGLVLAYFPIIQDNPLCQKRSYRVFQSTFHRTTGWSVLYCTELKEVTHWMPLPALSKD